MKCDICQKRLGKKEHTREECLNNVKTSQLSFILRGYANSLDEGLLTKDYVIHRLREVVGDFGGKK